MNFDEFECTNLKNSNLCKYVSKFCDTNFVEKNFKVSIEWYVNHIFWVRDCKKFIYGRLHSQCERTSKLDRILRKLHISWYFHRFTCIKLKNSNVYGYVCKFYDKSFVEEYFQVSIEWRVYHIFWIRGCKKFNHWRLLCSREMASKVDKVL